MLDPWLLRDHDVLISGGVVWLEKEKTKKCAREKSVLTSMALSPLFVPAIF